MEENIVGAEVVEADVVGEVAAVQEEIKVVVETSSSPEGESVVESVVEVAEVSDESPANPE